MKITYFKLFNHRFDTLQLVLIVKIKTGKPIVMFIVPWFGATTKMQDRGIGHNPLNIVLGKTFGKIAHIFTRIIIPNFFGNFLRIFAIQMV